MVARGDLGVEIGFERMAQIQEQILWICEAGHVPVIWATQVLKSLVKRGLPSVNSEPVRRHAPDSPQASQGHRIR
jgi:hypothetical protein